VSVIQPGGILDDQQVPLGGFKSSGVGREYGT
jgi:acyl-CoA reductase-like NAD-dependent aldehyde dehydrogenase